MALLQTYGTVFSRYARHLEAKSLDSAGRPSRGSGLLVRRPVREGSRPYVGKESNRIEEVETGLVHRLDEVIQEFGKALDPWHSWVVPVLQSMTLRELVEETGLDRRTIQRLRNRHSEPRPSTEKALTGVAGDWARERLLEDGLAAPRNDVLTCRAWAGPTPGGVGAVRPSKFVSECYSISLPRCSVRAVQDASVDVDHRQRVEAAYRDQADRMWRALFGYSGDRDVARDALAEAFARALQNEAVIEDLPAWLWRVSFRLASAELKHRGRMRHAPEPPSYEMPEPLPELMDALTQLSPKQRLALVLHDYADRPTHEVAQTIGCSRATVHVHLSKGRRRLRTLLEGDHA